MDTIYSTLKPEEQATLRLRSLYEQYGYKKYKVSSFEDYSFYLQYKGFLDNENCISFTDMDGKLMALKPDVTLSIIKNTGAKMAEKVYYLENVYRVNRESHTFQEISQIGLESIGIIDSFAILEVLTLAEESLSAIHPDHILEIGHMGFLIGLLDRLDFSSDLRGQLIDRLRAKSAHGVAAVAKEAGLKEEDAALLSKLATLSGDFEEGLSVATAIAGYDPQLREAIEELRLVYESAKELGAGEHLRLDFSLINDTAFYNGILFSGYINGIPRQVLAGGRYDNMMEKMGKKTQAIGFAIYLNELQYLPKAAAITDVDVLILYAADANSSELLAAVRGLISQGMRVRTERAIPPELRFNTLYRYENGKLEECTC